MENETNLNPETKTDETLGAGNETNNDETETKTYTQDEVDKLLQREADKRVSEALKKADRKKEAAVKEAEKLAKMDADEKYKYELEQREKQLQEREQKLALLENSNEASKILASKGLSISLVDFVVAEDADTMMGNIKLLEQEFKKSVKDEVEKRLGSKTPKNNLPDGTLTKDTFAKLSIVEQQKLYDENPSLYKKLMDK